MLQLLLKVLSNTSLCSRGQWDLGNTLVEICTTTMRVHRTESVFKGNAATCNNSYLCVVNFMPSLSRFVQLAAVDSRRLQ